MFEVIRLGHRRQRLEKLATVLSKRGYAVQVQDSAESIREAVLALVNPGDKVGLGGSVTIRELGLPEAIRAKGYEAADHWIPGITPEQIATTVRRHPTSDCFVTSSNAVTMDGQLVNIDGTGNRVVSMVYGPKRVVAVVGSQKIADNLDEAMERIRRVACPLNSLRRGGANPCAKAGRCVDCADNASMCMVTTIIAHKPPTIDFHVILTPLELGF
jgi:hypothetical protein